ncbi:hypothetical protein H4F33_14000 [Pectobacterium brasiliense]|uniref:hypothetical protein n=1 Tax=Pectobacterium brasiliense TaxID=180957 RepID=UPI0015DE236B|nr:hypothetical protein [Pectobacterium brasiliense]MBA0218795.1 hypothetical protein [Pectobacterium brasiliense]MBN3073195.1 hypothetical protein [Pectobacterium brasiliense]MBN3170616.1 hypothetical protein [Pectobacterium brasiliense]
MFKSYLQYPFNSILYDFPNSHESSLGTMLIDKWQRAIIAFYVPEINSNKNFISVGSGFLIKKNGFYSIITANHVVDELINRMCFFSLNNSFFPLDKIIYIKSESHDYAAIMPPKALMHSEENFIAFSDELGQDYEPTMSMIVSGCPSNKNKYKLDKSGINTQIYNIFFNSFEFDSRKEDIYFNFDSRKKMIRTEMFEPLSSGKSLPSLEGMSGGPVMQILKNKNTNALTLRVVGVFKEHHRQKGKYLVAGAFINFSEEIKALYN